MSEKRNGLWDFAMAHPWLTYWTIGSLIALIPNTIRAIKGAPEEPSVQESVARGAINVVADMADKKGGHVISLKEAEEEQKDGE